MEASGIRIAFDYVDPGSYLTWALMERWNPEAARRARLRWSPLELRIPGGERLDPAEPAWVELTRAIGLEAMEEAIPFDPPGFVPWTRKAHELALHAHEKGCFEAVHRTLFGAHFARGLDIGRVDVLVKLGEECALEAAETRAVLGVDRFLPAVEAARVELIAAGVRGVPTLEVNGRRLEGLKGASQLREFLADVEASF